MDRIGIIKTEDLTCSYQIGEAPMFLADESSKLGTDERPAFLSALAVSGYNVWPAGEDNLDPNTAKNMISGQ